VSSTQVQALPGLAVTKAESLGDVCRMDELRYSS